MTNYIRKTSSKIFSKSVNVSVDVDKFSSKKWVFFLLYGVLHLEAIDASDRRGTAPNIIPAMVLLSQENFAAGKRDTSVRALHLELLYGPITDCDNLVLSRTVTLAPARMIFWKLSLREASNRTPLPSLHQISAELSHGPSSIKYTYLIQVVIWWLEGLPRTSSRTRVCPIFIKSTRNLISGE